MAADSEVTKKLVAEAEEKHKQEILIEEYRVSWRYFLIILDENSKLTANFLRIVALPAAIVSAGAAYITKEGGGNALTRLDADRIRLVLGLIQGLLIVLLLVGFVSFTAVAKEDANSRNFVIVNNRIRAFWRQKYPDIAPALGMDLLPRAHRGWGKIGLWRAAVFVVINSATAAMVVFCAEPKLGMPALVLCFASSTLIHIFWHNYVTAGLDPKGG